MSTYKRMTFKVDSRDSKEIQAYERFAADIADMLTGPTSGLNAAHIATQLLSANEGKEVARAMINAAQRYLKAVQ